MARSKPRDKSRKTTHLPVIILTVATIACLLPFIGKAFNIDDPLFIWAAQHIRTHPFNPYGFDVNWYGMSNPMSGITQNPPLACYYIALASCFVGWSEAGIHLFMMIPAVAVILGTYRLAQRYCANPLLAGLATLLTPVFLVSSTTVMCDVLMLAFWIWATVLWIEGMDGEHQGKLAVASVLVAAAVLTKYYGATLIGLLLLYSVLKTRRFGWWAAYLLVPVGILGLYELGTHALYGRALFSNAAAYANSHRFLGERHFYQKLLIGLVFTGGCLIPLVFYAPLLWSRKSLAVGAAAIAAIAPWLIHLGALGGLHIRENSGIVHWSPVAQISLYAVVGMSVVVLAVSDAVKRRDTGSIFLCLWVLGTFAFASLVNWSTNGRSILPAVPAMGILIVRRLELRFKASAFHHLRWMLAPLIISAIVSVWVAYGDCRLANASRTAATDVYAKYAVKGKTMQVQGHWGFQYYMLKAGAVETNARDCRILPGEIVAIDLGNPNPLEMPMKLFNELELAETPVDAGVTTMDRELGAGFYSDAYGPLPFSVGRVPAVQTQIIAPRTTIVFDDGRCTSDHFHLANALERAGKLYQALAEFRAAYRLGAEQWPAANSIAWILATNPRLGKPVEAVHWGEIACRLTDYKQPGILDTMAAAYASAGRYDEALATAEKAAQLAESRHQPAAARYIRSRIPLYRAHKPYLEPENSR